MKWYGQEESDIVCLNFVNLIFANLLFLLHKKQQEKQKALQQEKQKAESIVASESIHFQ